MVPPGNYGRSRWSSKNRSDESFSYMVVAGGVAKAVLFVIALALVASTVVYFTELDEGILRWAVNAGSFVVLGAASFVTAKKAGSHGLFYGVAVGLGYAVVTAILGLALFPPLGSVLSLLKRLGFSVLAGACGGILGVNY